MSSLLRLKALFRSLQPPGNLLCFPPGQTLGAGEVKQQETEQDAPCQYTHSQGTARDHMARYPNTHGPGMASHSDRNIPMGPVPSFVRPGNVLVIERMTFIRLVTIINLKARVLDLRIGGHLPKQIPSPERSITVTRQLFAARIDVLQGTGTAVNRHID